MQQKSIKTVIVKHCKKCSKKFEVFRSCYRGHFASTRDEKTYCGRACANFRVHSPTTKNKISQSLKKLNLKGYFKFKVLKSRQRKLLPRTGLKCKVTYIVCNICKKLFTRRPASPRKSCSNKCYRKQCAINAIEQQKKGKGLRGTYKGIRCDSTYELAFVIWCDMWRIKLERCKESFEYTFLGKTHRYNPDFMRSDGAIIEVKGYVTEQTKQKLKCVPKHKKFLVFYSEDIIPMIQTIVKKFNVEKIEHLYDEKNTKFCSVCSKEFAYSKKQTCSLSCVGKLTRILYKQKLKKLGIVKWPHKMPVWGGKKKNGGMGEFADPLVLGTSA